MLLPWLFHSEVKWEGWFASSQLYRDPSLLYPSHLGRSEGQTELSPAYCLEITTQGDTYRHGPQISFLKDNTKVASQI